MNDLFTLFVDLSSVREVADKAVNVMVAMDAQTLYNYMHREGISVGTLKKE